MAGAKGKVFAVSRERHQSYCKTIESLRWATIDRCYGEPYSRLQGFHCSRWIGRPGAIEPSVPVLLLETEGRRSRSNKERRQRTPAVVASFSEGLQLRLAWARPRKAKHESTTYCGLGCAPQFSFRYRNRSGWSWASLMSSGRNVTPERSGKAK